MKPVIKPDGRAVQSTCRAACPKCRSGNTKVIITRSSTNGLLVRRRSCRDCGHRFWTLQEPEWLIKSSDLTWFQGVVHVVSAL